MFCVAHPHARPRNMAYFDRFALRNGGFKSGPGIAALIRATSFTQRTATIVVAREGRRVLPLIERNILMILFRHRIPVTRGHGATIDRTVDLLLPGHPGRLLFLRRQLLLFRSRVLSSRRSEERRVGKECRCCWWTCDEHKE